MAKALCPKCKTVSSLPDAFVGRTVRCKVCKGQFVATAMPKVASTAPGAASVTDSGAFSIVNTPPAAASTMLGIPGSARGAGATMLGVPGAAPDDGATPPGAASSKQSGVRARGTKGSGIVTVVARRVGASGSSSTNKATGSSFVVRAGVLLLSALALLLPISCAGAFAAFKWRQNHSKDSSSAKARGEFYGGIEIGSGGIRGTVIDLFQADDNSGDDYYMPFKESHDTKVITDMEKTGEFHPEALVETLEIVQKYFKTMTEDYRIPPERIRIVGGTSLFNALDKYKGTEDVKAALLKKNKTALIDKVANVTGKQMDFLDVGKEVELMIAGLVKRRDASRAILIDVGGGGTRGGYREPGGKVVAFKGPGLKDFESKVKAKGGKPADFPTIANDLTEKELHEPFRKELEGDRKAGLNNRDVVYLNGGIVWVMALFTHPTDRSALVKLSAQDIEDFQALLGRNREKAFPTLSLPDNMDPKVREEVLAEVEDMKTKFKMSRLLAGAEVLKALAAEFKFQGKELYFNRYGDVGWLLADIVQTKAAKK